MHGCFTALITPMYEDGSIDFDSLTALIHKQLLAKIDGIVILGSTAEASSLSSAEKLAIIQHVLLIVQSATVVIVGVGAPATHICLEFIDSLKQFAGIDYLLCVTPYYTKPTTTGLLQHFMKLADHSPWPIILYNVPSRTAVDLQTDSIQKLAVHPNIVGLKDATGEVSRLMPLIHLADFSFLSGDDLSFIEYIGSGGDGVVSVVSNLIPQFMSKACKHDADIIQTELYNNILPQFLHNIYCTTNPIAIKWLLHAAGYITSAMTRLPLCAPTTVEQLKLQHALEVLNKYNIL